MTKYDDNCYIISYTNQSDAEYNLIIGDYLTLTFDVEPKSHVQPLNIIDNHQIKSGNLII